MENGLRIIIVIKTDIPFSILSLIPTSRPEDHREVSYVYKTLLPVLEKIGLFKDKHTAKFILLIELEERLCSWNPTPPDI